MQEAIAHFYRVGDSMVIQSVKQHCSETANLAAGYAKGIGFYYFMKLAGVLHDMGKYNPKFQEYIKMQMEQEGKNLWGLEVNGTRIDHAYAGTCYIYSRYHNGEKERRETAEILMMLIAYHHGGMEDFITVHGEVPLLERVRKGFLYEDRRNDKTAEFLYMEEQFEREVCSREELDKLFSCAVQEYMQFQKKQFEQKQIYLKENGIKGKQAEQLKNSKTYEFMLIRVLYSCLIDADRTNTADFMEQRERGNIRTDINWKGYEEKLEKKLRLLQENPTGTEKVIPH